MTDKSNHKGRQDARKKDAEEALAMAEAVGKLQSLGYDEAAESLKENYLNNPEQEHSEKRKSVPAQYLEYQTKMLNERVERREKEGNGQILQTSDDDGVNPGISIGIKLLSMASYAIIGASIVIGTGGYSLFYAHPPAYSHTIILESMTLLVAGVILFVISYTMHAMRGEYK